MTTYTKQLTRFATCFREQGGENRLSMELDTVVARIQARPTSDAAISMTLIALLNGLDIQRDDTSLAEHVASLAAIPDAYISDAMRVALIKRAIAGEEVYAYSNEGGQRWNLWDTDTRIILPPIATSWQIAGLHYRDGSAWQMSLKSPDGYVQHTLTIFIDHQASYSSDQTGAGYQARAARVALDAINHCSMFGINPLQLNNTHH